MPSELETLCADKGIVISAVFGAATEPHARMPNNWRVRLYYKRRQLTCNFYGGSAVTEINAADVLFGLCIYAAAVDLGFEDWASDFGYDRDSREAEKTYKLCCKLGRKVYRFLGDDFEMFRNAEH